VKLANCWEEIEQALQLRYQVFVEEAGNLSMMNESKMEQDRYDNFCDHVIVKDLETDKIVGTYRLLPGDRTSETAGFYSETEFDLASLHVTDIQALNNMYTMLLKTGLISNRFGISPLATHRIDQLQILDLEFSPNNMIRKLPPLMKGYYWLGAEIGGEPAFDPIFQTTDFFMILDPLKISKRYKRHFFSE
jgi:L-ornithine Nalpha-acyltransferase